MSGFQGANTFLSSELKTTHIGPNPATERGAGVHVNEHPKENKIIYPSGKFVVVKSLDDPSDCFVYRGHQYPCTVAKFSPNGYWVASADTAGKVRVWSWDNPEHLLKIEVPVFAGSIKDLDWDPESKKIVAVGEGSGIMAKVFTWDTGNSVGEIVGHAKRILSVAYKPSRPFRIMTSSEDQRTIFYAGPPFKLDHPNAGQHSNFVNCVRFNKDGSKCVSVGTDKLIQLYDGKTGLPEGSVPNAHAGGIYSVSWSPCGGKFATCSADKTIKVWDAASLALESTLNVSADPQVGDMQASIVWTREKGIVSLSLNGNINIIDPAAPGSAKTIEAHQTGISALFYEPSTSTLYTGSNDGVVIARNMSTGAATKVKTQDKRNVYGGAHGGKVTGLAVIGPEVVTVGWDDSIRYADVAAGAYTASSSLDGQPVALAASPTNAGLLVVATNKGLALYNGKDKIAAISDAQLGFTPTCVAVQGSAEVCVGGDDNKAHFFSISDNVFTAGATIEGRSAVTSVAYSPDGAFLAVGDSGRQVDVYEKAANWAAKVKGRWCYHTARVAALSWSPNGQYLASGSLDERVIVWDLNNINNKTQLDFAHTGGVTGLAWADDSKLYSAGADHCVVAWNIPH